MKQKREREKSDADDADAFIEAAQSTATLYTIAFFFLSLFAAIVSVAPSRCIVFSHFPI